MIYGEEKIRQMVRSILPSKKAKTAKRDKISLNKRLRRGAKRSLKLIKDEEDWYEDLEDYWDDGQLERSMIVGMRRGSIKINHFKRWAESRARHIPDGEKMDYIKGIIKGKGVIIEHAYSHLNAVRGFEKNIYKFNSYRYIKNQLPEFSGEDMMYTIQKILEDSWALRRLNYFIKSGTSPVSWYKFEKYISYYNSNYEPVYKDGFKLYRQSGKPMMLLGHHNIQEFVSRYRYPVSYQIPGDGIHYRKNYNQKYDQSFLPNPESQPHLKLIVMAFIETYFDSDGDPRALEALEKRIHSNMYFYRFDYTPKYNWLWDLNNESEKFST